MQKLIESFKNPLTFSFDRTKKLSFVTLGYIQFHGLFAVVTLNHDDEFAERSV